MTHDCKHQYYRLIVFKIARYRLQRKAQHSEKVGRIQTNQALFA